jgi:mono/diheme cytochrome c family protein
MVSRDPRRRIIQEGMDMNRVTPTFAGLVLALVAISVVVGCSTRQATENADAVRGTGAAASRPAAGADRAPLETVTRLLTAPEGATDLMVQEGMQIYAGAGICAACHGPDATGAIGPDLTDGEWLIGDGEYEQLVTQILEGVSAAEATNPLGAIMPPKGGAGITEAQVRSVAAYVWALSH